MKRGLMCDFKPPTRGVRSFVQRSEGGARRDQRGGQQGHTHLAAAESVEFFALNEVQRFGDACRGDGVSPTSSILCLSMLHRQAI